MSAGPGGARRRACAALTLALGLLLALAAGELAVRLWRGRLFSLRSPRHDLLRLLRSAYPAEHDPLLGYVPRAGFHGTQNAWHTQVTIDGAGLRSNGAPPPDGTPLVAVGDSFTFGDEVSDADTWPARLERRLGRPVLNGGVFGYGFDQTALRAERLIAGRPVAGLIVALIPDDLERCEYAYRFAAKPYFDVAAGRLALRHVPVPPPPERLEAYGPLAYSHLVDFVMLRLRRERWLAGATDLVRVHRQGEQVARLLVERLAAAAAARGVPWLLVALGDPAGPSGPTDALLRHARERGVAGLDLLEPLRQELGADPGLRARLFLAPGAHLSPAGNDWVAARVAARLRELGWLGPPAPRR